MRVAVFGFFLWFMLGLTGWLAWTVALNTPFMPDGLPRAEGVIWPGLVLIGCVAFAVAILFDLIRARATSAAAALALALVLAALAVRLTVLPLLPTLMPLALIGLREGLSVLALLYAGFAFWIRMRSRAETGDS